MQPNQETANERIHELEMTIVRLRQEISAMACRRDHSTQMNAIISQEEWIMKQLTAAEAQAERASKAMCESSRLVTAAEQAVQQSAATSAELRVSLNNANELLGFYKAANATLERTRKAAEDDCARLSQALKEANIRSGTRNDVIEGWRGTV